jgi:prolyl-tRNA editing enzyme YbaK/EbsC (Cys-tRNA(Pro) deacylase)
MAVEKVKKYFEQFDMKDKVLEFDTSSATVELAAMAVGCEPKRIAKTLSFLIEDNCILIVTAGDAKVDNKKYKQQFSKKAKMVPFEDVERITGHGIGGVCPFAINEGVEVFLDESLKRFSTVFPACGSANSAIELSIPEMEKYTNYKEWIDVCKDWE